jgi:hypothetical protein
MKQEEWLTQYIADAFAGVTLGDGIDIHRAESMDDYGNPDEDRLSLAAERNDWRKVSADVLFSRHCAVTFLDSTGFRFYAPAIMTTIINRGDGNGMLLDAFLWNLKISIHGKIKDVAFNDLFTRFQRAAIIRFLKFLIHHKRDRHYTGDADRVLDEIQSRT